MALVQNVALARVILLVVIGPTHIGLHTTLTTLVQRGSNDANRGRVFALVGAVTGALFLVGTVGEALPAALVLGSVGGHGRRRIASRRGSRPGLRAPINTVGRRAARPSPGGTSSVECQVDGGAEWIAGCLERRRFPGGRGNGMSRPSTALQNSLIHSATSINLASAAAEGC